MHAAYTGGATLAEVGQQFGCSRATVTRAFSKAGLTNTPAPRGPATHLLSEIDTERRTAICAACGPVTITKGGGCWRCSIGRRQSERLRSRPHLAYRGDTCERCDFVPEHPCQLDVHHLDGNHDNNDPENFQTLCANCHRIVTHNETHSVALLYRQSA